MAASIHPAATHNVPSFITAPGETDVLMVVVGFVLFAAIMSFGILFLRLHTLPERIAHRGHKLQFEIVAVLGLLALFTHMHIFWVAGLLLALIDFPNFGGWLSRIAISVEKMAGIKPAEESANASGQAKDTIDQAVPGERAALGTAVAQRDGAASPPARPELVSAGTRS
jgi:hypothetical protein